MLATSLLLAAVVSIPAAAAAAAVRGRDAYVLISGGGTPLTNNYSQYLQARAMADHFQTAYPIDSVWIFFGAGNRDGEKPIVSDVRRQIKRDGLIVESWHPGPLRQNRPATRDVLLKALREEILPAVRDGHTLYLFIGDHGSLGRTAPKESVVTLWQLKKKGPGNDQWRTDPAEELSVTDLRNVLKEGLGKGRVVFCMTQCHSGGFHFLGVPRTIVPDPSWFERVVPEWAMPVDEAALPLAAGFTAVDEQSLAAGCDPDPDPDRWAGYERYVPEQLLGIDLFSGKKKGSGVESFLAAHEASVLIDQTIDKPRSSSDQYLERWAAMIEGLAKESGLAPPIQAQVTAYLRNVDHGLAEIAGGPDFQGRRDVMDGFIARMTEQNASAASLLRGGSRAELEAAFASGRHRGGPAASSPKAAASKDNPWTTTIRPAWQAAVKAGNVDALPAKARAFERYLLGQEDKGRDFMFAKGWMNPMLNDLFWQSGYAFPGKTDREKAEAVTFWGAERTSRILTWAKASADPAVREAAGKLEPMVRRRQGDSSHGRTLSTAIAAERTLFYRRVLAAWAFLIAMDQREALAKLDSLLELERTPLPPPVEPQKS